MLLLEVFDLEKMYGDRKLFSVQHLAVYDGDRIGVVGVNGAGKTTLFNIMFGADHDYKGQIMSHAKGAMVKQLDERDADYLSGGEKTRLKIDHAFQQKAKVLFADEPTSHLDLPGIEMVEERLQNYPGAVLVISHDRELLNKICTSIWEVEEGHIHIFKGNYDDYQAQKQRIFERAEFEYEQYVKEKTRLKATIQERRERTGRMNRPPSRMGRSESALHKGKASGKIARINRSIKVVEKRIEQIEEKEKPKAPEKVVFDTQAFDPIHSKTAIRFDGVEKSFADRQLFQPFSATVKPGDKLGIIGPNGCGKSTLLKMILKGEKGIEISQAAKIGYYAQDLSILDESKSLYENVIEKTPFQEPFVRLTLARLLFKGEEVHKPVRALSGGERVKAALAKIFLGKYNLLLLDEPTNYLDLFTKDALEEILRAYPGTMIFATHDRGLLNRLVDSVLVFHDQKVIPYRGTYREFLQKTQAPRRDIDRENRLKTLQLEITTILGQLSLEPDENEKQKLEARFEQLLKEKKTLE
ncbi:ribosomal protection-like ABC-F family protein [Camelliibacillus cellulosilyticus]|uniref:Ribosomal protection-like ABC-F family protein n=1 Tax=Camelliibacillus cellulosilyticus TaxID=2174486 RepID=A0ABV9GJW5_9BACL